MKIERSVVLILHWSYVNFSGHKKWISEAPLDQVWYTERVVYVQVKYSWAPYVDCTQKTGVKLIPRGDPNASFLMWANDQGKLNFNFFIVSDLCHIFIRCLAGNLVISNDNCIVMQCEVLPMCLKYKQKSNHDNIHVYRLGTRFLQYSNMYYKYLDFQ